MTPEEKLRRVKLDDIPGQLRQMADDIDAGRFDPASLLVVAPPEASKWPKIYGWGEALSDLELIAIFELAKGYFVANQTERSR